MEQAVKIRNQLIYQTRLTLIVASCLTLVIWI